MVRCDDVAARTAEGHQRVIVTAAARRAVLDRHGPHDRVGQVAVLLVDGTAGHVDRVAHPPGQGPRWSVDRHERRRVVRRHEAGRLTDRAVPVGDRQADVIVAGREHVIEGGRAGGGAAAVVEVPRVRQPAGDLGRRRRSIEVDVQRSRPGARAGGERSVRRRIADPVDVAGRAGRGAQVHVQDVAGRVDGRRNGHELNGTRPERRGVGCVRLECHHRARVGQATGPGGHERDAPARVVGDEQAAVVRGRVRPAAVKGDPGDRSTAGRAGVAGDHVARSMAVGPDRGRRRAGCLERRAQGRLTHVVVVPVVEVLVARPAEVRRAGRARRRRQVVELFPGVVADVADPEVVGPGPEREPERVAQAVAHDPPLVRVGRADERVARRRRPRWPNGGRSG